MNVLHQKLKSLPLYDSLNVIITSDHGMAMIYEDSTIILSDIVNMEWIQEIQGGNPAYSIMAREGYVDSIMNALTKVSHLKAWKTGQEPAHLHYGTHPRTLDITVTTDPHWSVYAEKPDRFMQVPMAMTLLSGICILFFTLWGLLLPETKKSERFTMLMFTM